LGTTKQVFTRDASGLIRQATLTDVLFIGIFNAGAILVNVLLIPLYLALFPGASLPLAGLIGVGLGIPVMIAYSAIGSTMPRTGGDYVYQTRGINGLIGFSQTMGILVFLAWPFVTAAAVLAIAVDGISTMASFIGASQGNVALMNLGTWLSTPTGEEVAVLIAFSVALVNVILGVKWYTKVLRYVVVPLMAITAIITVYVFATINQATFISHFNNFGSAFGVNDLYHAVLTQASNNGYVNPPFSLINTLLVSFVVAAYCFYGGAANYLLGEVKGASIFKKLSSAYVLSTIIAIVAFTVIETYLIQQVVGWNFLNALSFVGQFESFGVISHPIMPFYPQIGAVTAIAAGSPALIFLSLLGYIAAGYALMAFALLGMSRILMAMSLDGVVPAGFSKVSQRFYTPQYALIFVFVIDIVLDTIFILFPQTYLLIINGTTPAATLDIFFTAVAVALFPFTQRAIFSSGPVSRYRTAIVSLALVSAVITAAVTLSYFVVPAYGVGIVGVYINVIAFVLAAAWYLGFKAYKKSKGIDIGLAFRLIPPE
jgi:basic amino acid/polyamine antiporter, APA family